MPPKFVILALFLIFTGSFAQYTLGTDQNDLYLDRDSLLQKVLEDEGFILTQNTWVVEGDKKSHITDFARGFLEGVGTAGTFAEIKECIQTSEKVSSDIITAIREIKTKNPEKVKEGIELLGEAAEIVPDAVKTCKATKDDFERLLKLVNVFKDPTSFIYHISKSLLINRVEVITEVTDAVKAYDAQNFTGLGYWVGVAMDTIILGDSKTLNQKFADHLNEVSGWKAQVPKKFEGMTLEEIKNQYLGAQRVDYSKFDNLTEFNYEGSITDIPSEFDSRTQWPTCVHPVRDQGQCGSCWAFAASEVLSDRFCVASNASVQVILSPQYLISCDKPLGLGCDGGVPIFSWWFMINKGVVSDDCLPYLSYDGKNPLSCSDFKSCKDGSPMKFYHALNKSAVLLKGPKSIQADILQYGPIEAGFMVYEDFMYYSGGIYKHTSGAFEGLHAVKIIGWGNENGTDYWLVQNSWGTNWGLNGFFKIAFGQCEIDVVVASGQADLTRLNQTPNTFW